MNYITKVLLIIKSFFLKEDEKRESEYSTYLTSAIADVNGLVIGEVFDIGFTSSSVLNYNILYKCKTFYVLQIDLLEQNGNATPYVWLRLDKDLKIQSIAREKEALFTFSSQK
jgi:hypothetical protein